jgi:hypothetical protein
MDDDDYLIEEVDSFGPDNLAIPKNPWGLEEYRDQLLATARSLRERERQIKDEHDAINNKWTTVLVAELEQEARPQEPKSYPRRMLFSSSDEDEYTPRRPDPYRPDQPPRGRDRPFTRVTDPPIPRHKGKEPMDPNDLRYNLNART